MTAHGGHALSIVIDGVSFFMQIQETLCPVTYSRISGQDFV